MAVASRKSFILRKGPKPYREVSEVYRVPPGIYCLVVSYGLPNHQGEYVLRIATEKPITSWQLTVPTQASLNLKFYGNKFAQMFRKHTGGDQHVDALELRSILNNGLFKGAEIISLETARILIGAASPKMPGKLDFDQTEIQWKLVQEHVNSFEVFDKDSSAMISVRELVDALGSLGVDLRERTVRAVGFRYGGKKAAVSFDDFVQCSVKIIKLIEVYQRLIMMLEPPTGAPRIGLEQWMETMLLC